MHTFDSLANQASAAISAGRWHEARFLVASLSAPDDDERGAILGMLLFQTENYSAAARSFAAIEPKSPAIWGALSICAIRLDQQRTAAACLRSALQGMPQLEPRAVTPADDFERDAAALTDYDQGGYPPSRWDGGATGSR